MEDNPLKTALLEKTVTKQDNVVKVQSSPSKPPQEKVNISHIKQQTVQKQSNRVVGKNQINFWGGQVKDEQALAGETQSAVQHTQSSSVIEKPNYDFIEPLSKKDQKKIFKIERKKEKKATSPLLKKIKIAVFVLLIGVLGSWTVYNAVELSNVAYQYNLKLDQYLLKLGTLDSASNANDLFPTYPKDSGNASSIGQQSNWFDRFCNFIGGIFGG